MDKLLYNLRFSLRVFLKDKFFSVLNILGLSLGIAVSILLMLILKNDLSYDKHYTNHENIYRVGSHYVIPDVDMEIGFTARELAPILRQHYPEIGHMTRVDNMHHVTVKDPENATNKTFYEERVAQVDSTYFEVFSHTFINGDVNTCLDDKNSVVITRAMALKYFGTEDALNKLLVIKNEARNVTAVIEDYPETTHNKIDFITAGLPEIRPTWDFTMKDGKPIALVMWNPDVLTYITLPKNYDVTNFYGRFQSLYDEYFVEQGADSEFSINKIGSTNSNTPILQPLAGIHLSGVDQGNNSEVQYLIAFTGIGALIVLLACINYMNLATAKAIKRSTEITMKRIAGSGRTQLIFSLMGESVLMALMALVVAIGIVYTILNATSFNIVIGRHLVFDLTGEPMVLLASLAIALTIGMLSGIYPAFYLTGVPVIDSLKRSFTTTRSALFMRRSLITIQFGVSIFVVVCTVFMSDQLKFIRTKGLGFNKDNLLVIPIEDKTVANAIDGLSQELIADRRVVATSAAGSVIGTGIYGEQMLVEGETGMEQRGITTLSVGDGYLEMMGIELVSGRTFAEGEGIETEGLYLANEAAVKLMGWGNDAIGKKAAYFGNNNPGKIVGVVKDFNVNSLHASVDPMLIVKWNGGQGYYHIRLTGDDIPGVVEMVKGKFSKIDPDHPFEYFFLDQKYDEQYRADITQNQLISVLSYVCVFISLLGLLGLSAFAAVQRTKEIGVRKVLGASVSRILVMLSKDVVLLVAIAIVVAAPLSWWILDSWMEGFAYRAPMNLLLFGGIMIGSMMFVVIVTMFQSFRTANANPVESLKYE